MTWRVALRRVALRRVSPRSCPEWFPAQVRIDLLRSLALLEVDETVLGSLRSSGLGKFVRLYSLHQKETAANKKQANALVEKWKRPIFGSSMAYSAAEVPVFEGRSAAELLASAEVDPHRQPPAKVTFQSHIPKSHSKVTF